MPCGLGHAPVGQLQERRCWVVASCDGARCCPRCHRLQAAPVPRVASRHLAASPCAPGFAGRCTPASPLTAAAGRCLPVSRHRRVLRCLPLPLPLQVLTSLLFEASLLGLVFARISNSAGRSATIRFRWGCELQRGSGCACVHGVAACCHCTAYVQRACCMRGVVLLLAMCTPPAHHPQTFTCTHGCNACPPSSARASKHSFLHSTTCACMPRYCVNQPLQLR